MATESERLEFLRGIPVFAGVEDAALSELAAGITETTFKAGELVFREKESGSEMIVIQSGRVAVIKHLGQARETNLATLGPRDFFGEMAIIECVSRSASVRALEQAVLLRIRSLQLHRLYEHRPDQYSIIILNIARDISRRLRALDENWSEASLWRSLDEAMLRAMDG